MSSQITCMDSFREFQSFMTEEFHTDLSQTHVESQLPKVTINLPVLQPATVPRNEVELAFIPKDDKITLWKQILFTWKTKGISHAFELLSQSNVNKNSVNKLTYGLWKLWKTVKTIQCVVMPLSNVSSNVNMVSMFSRTKDWLGSPVRGLAWHPNCNKLAVATRDDTVLVYAGATSVPVVVRHSSQKDISSLAWRPLCSAQLAVGCASGVALWTVDPASLGTRPSASCLVILPHPSSVNAISWDPQGKYLASGSAKDSSLYIWCVESREATLLQKFRGSGYTFLSWSPTGEHLLAGTPGPVFKIWETRTWSAEIWDVMEGHVQSASWSPCGTKALFADSVQPTLYCVSVDRLPSLGEKMTSSLKNSSKAATVVADFTETEAQLLDDETKFGGVVQDLVWDPRGERLAVLFRSTGFVALFRTRYSPTLNLFPCGVLKGEPGEIATTIQFKPEFESGALLTVAWSTGRIQHVGFSFLPQHLAT